MTINDRILAFYDAHKKPLPWREHPSAYHIWISEVMCQQTRVATVVPYFLRFIEKLPDLESLARVSEEELMKLWEGLGYYRRARLLKKGAQEMLKRGAIPSTRAELLEIPGIGEYTASAVASMAFGEKTPAVDGNLMRIYARLTEEKNPIDSVATRRKIYRRAYEDMGERPGDFNQGMMELGQEICLPKNPRCDECPLQKYCLAYSHGTMEEFPVRKERKKRRVEPWTVLMVERGDAFLLEQRGGEFLGGLHGFPLLTGHRSREEVYEFLKRRHYNPLMIKEGPKARSIFSHREWHMISYWIRLVPEPFLIAEESEDWVSRKELKRRAFPRAFREFLLYLEEEEKN